MKKYLLLIFIVLPLIIAVSPLSAGAQQESSFSWTLGLQNVKTGDMVSFSAPVQSWTGEQFRLVVESGAACFCYVIAESPDGSDVSVLRAGSLNAGTSWYSPVMELTEPRGSESLFIVVSQTEQKTLAQRIDALKTGSTTSQRALMNEIFRLRGEASKFKEEPEKPVLMGGAARGASDKSQGVEYSGLGTYIKTISIEH